MRFACIVIIIFLHLALSHCGALPKDSYIPDESFRSLYSCYKEGDTIIFRSSTNLTDSFVISNIDSITDNSKKIFFYSPNYRAIFVSYRQIPIDKWQELYPVVKKGELQYSLEDGTFISIEKLPAEGYTRYYFNFKKFGCNSSDIPQLQQDTLVINGYKFTNYYKIDWCCRQAGISDCVQACYFTRNKGLVAFTTKENVSWTRIN